METSGTRPPPAFSSTGRRRPEKGRRGGFKKSERDKPLFRHLTQFFLFGGYRSHLIDVLEAVANADPTLAETYWVRTAISVVDGQTVDGKVVLAKNYPTKLVDPLPFEPVGKPSRFLTYQWLRVKEKFGLSAV